MMTTINLIWSAITPEKGKNIMRRADPAHPLDFFVGYDENCKMQLVLLSDYLPELPDSSQQVLVRGNQRIDGKYAICFSLINAAFREMFFSLCWDIMESTYRAADKGKGVLAAVKRFSMWQVLMTKSKPLHLSDIAIKGLIGELAVLRDICMPRYGKTRAVVGWIGPLYADRDFEFEDLWLEAKAVSKSKDYIQISSFDQFDTDQNGKMVICRIDKAEASDSKAVSLNEVISSIECLLSDDDDALTVFRIRLNLTGYNASDAQSGKPFRIHHFEIYDVAADFPRIRKNQLHSAIGNGEYTLTISELQPWRIE